MRAGLVAFAFALSVPFVGGPAARIGAGATVAAAFEPALVAQSAREEPLARAPQRVRDGVLSEVVAGVAFTPEPAATPEPTLAPTPRPAPTAVPQPVVAVPATAEPTSGVVLASWYGPGFYGNRTACGQTYTPEIQGVAHKTLPCGTVLTLSYGGRTVVVTVIDRGPYVAGRVLDLSNATRLALGCPDLCRVTMRIGQ